MPDTIRQYVRTFTHDGLEFQYLELGRPDQEAVILLHGFPQNAQTWLPVMEELSSKGYRVLALNQRGYSPNATPLPFWQYRLSKLMSDAVALIAAADGIKVHLVGHDLGAEVAWNVAAAYPDLVQSLTAVSSPHPRALSRAFLTSDQALRSWYISFFQLPLIPEWTLRARDGAIAVRLLEKTGMPRASAERYTQRLLEAPHALAGAIDWYRAFALTPGLSLGTPPVSIPTRYIWGSNDVVVSRVGSDYTARYVKGPYDFKILDGTSHWVPEEAPRELAELIASHARQHKSRPPSRDPDV